LKAINKSTLVKIKVDPWELLDPVSNLNSKSSVNRIFLDRVIRRFEFSQNWVGTISIKIKVLLQLENIGEDEQGSNLENKLTIIFK
jgi:hypothetical protein